MHSFVVCVSCAIRKDDRFLVIQRPEDAYAGGLLSFPGGKVDIQDAEGHAQNVLRSAARREVLEEVGLSLPLDPYYVTTSYFRAEHVKADVLDHLFYSEVASAEISVSEREVAAYHWMTLDELKNDSRMSAWLLGHVRALELFDK